MQTWKSSCPEPVSSVTVNQTTINMGDGDVDVFEQETLTLTNTTGNEYTAELSRLPYTDDWLRIYLNGVLLVAGTDYTRNLKTITFTFTEDFVSGEEQVTAAYLGTDYARLESAIQPGMIVPAATAGTYEFIGFLPCDGASYLRTAKPALFAAIGTSYGVGDDDPNTFNVPDLTASVVDGGLVSGTINAWIKE